MINDRLALVDKVENDELSVDDLVDGLIDSDVGAVADVVIDADNKVHYYQGECNPEVHTTNFSANGIRQVLFDYKRKIGDVFTVVIKSTDKAKYRNMVDLLDEMTITNNKHYAIVSLTDEDKKRIKL